MLQASTAHADFKHACTYVPFLPRGFSVRTLLVRTRRTDRLEGKDLCGRHLRQVRPPDRDCGGTTRQPQQHQREQRDQGNADTTLHTTPAVPAATAAGSTGTIHAASRVRPGGQPGTGRSR